MLGKLFKRKPYEIGFALSGGGIKGLCHAGVLKAFEEFDIKPDVIAGVSAGSIVGALYADGYTPEQILNFFTDISFRQMTTLSFPSLKDIKQEWLSLHTSNIFAPTGGIFTMDPMENFLRKHLKAKKIEDLPIPLKIVATDLDHGTAKIFESGDLVDCIVASCSMPIIFVPKMIDGVYYVDGGVVQNFPVSTIKDDCQYVVGVNASPLVIKEYKVSLFTVAQRSYNFMYKANTIHDKELCDLLIEPSAIGNFDTFDVDKAKEIYNLGYKTAKRIIKKEYKINK